MSNRSALALGAALVIGFAIGSGATFVALRSHGARDPAIAAAPSGEQIGARVSEILRGEDPLERITQLGALLSKLGPTDAPPVVEAFATAPLGGGDPELVLLGMWRARFDPDAAFRWSQSERRARFGNVIAAVIRSWARGDPARALGTARGLSFPGQRDLAIEAAVAGWDESGKPGLLEALLQLPEVEQQRVAEGVARRRVATLAPAEAFRWVESLDATPAFREMMAVRVASAAAEFPAGSPIAAAWATPRVRSDDRLSSYPRRIATRWVVHDPEAAMAWLATLPAGADRSDGVTEAFRAWMLHNYKAALAWIEHAEIQPWNEPALAVYARGIADERPTEAVELAQRISDPELRERTLIVLGHVWAKNDRAGLEAWLAQPGVPERVRQAF